jgi:hypothetical protein
MSKCPILVEFYQWEAALMVAVITIIHTQLYEAVIELYLLIFMSPDARLQLKHYFLV